MHTRLILILALFAGLSLQAQTNVQDRANADKNAAELLVLERGVITDAKTLARTSTLEKTGELTRVENLLTALNEAKAGTAEWQMETAQRLVHLAEQMAREGKPQSIPKLIERALQQLEGVSRVGATAEARASAKVLAGFIQERYLADDDAAQESYRAAATLDPKNAAASEKYQRVQRKLETKRERKPRG